MLQKFVTPCILQSNDLKTIVYCGYVNKDNRTGHGVCLKSQFESDIGMVSPGFNLDKFKPYPSREIPEHWNKHIEEYKTKHSIK